MEIALFTTGGTIDGADSDQGVTRPGSAAAELLSQIPDITLKHTPLFNKDSRDIDQTDLELLARAITECSGRLIIITHGTYTIAATGRFLKRFLGRTDKSILPVGSWTALGASESDGPKQLRFAVQSHRYPTKGVWIAMDNSLWDPDTTEKVELETGGYTLKTVG